MAFTRPTSGAVLAFNTLAYLADKDVCSATNISKALGCRLSHLYAILRRLAAQGYIQSLRGVQGGYSLAVAPESISLGEVLELIDGPLIPVESGIYKLKLPSETFIAWVRQLKTERDLLMDTKVCTK